MLHDSKRVFVGVRIRPKLDGAVNALHTAERYEQMACSLYSDNTLCLWDGRSMKDTRTFFFSYDSVFDHSASQDDVYEEFATTAVGKVLSGTSASVLTYGQTGSGKTYTILGDVRKNAVGDDIITDDTGILLRTIQEILHYAFVHKESRHVVVGISAVEIYRDDVRDLLSDEQASNTIQMVVMKDVVRFPKLTYVPIRNLEDGLAVYRRATARRAQRMTSANDVSSRSHAVFTIEVFQQPLTPKSAKPMGLAECVSLRDMAQIEQLEGKPLRPLVHEFFKCASNPLLNAAGAPLMYSKLSLADLAGSEKVRTANAQGEAFDELKKINASLTALGNVVHGLHVGSRHVPYRDSKLTTVLRDSFSAHNSLVVLMVNVSPTVLTVDETLSSLYFADKVKTMKVAPGVTAAIGQGNLGCEYLKSLREYEMLVSEMSIAGKLHRFSSPQIIPLIAEDRENVVYDLAFRITRPASEIRRLAVATMSDVFRSAAEDRERSGNNREKQRRELEETEKDAFNGIVGTWRQRTEEVQSHIQHFIAEESSQEFIEERDWIPHLEEAAASCKDARDARRSIKQECAALLADVTEAINTIRALDGEIDSFGNTQRVDDAGGAALEKGEDDAWALVSTHFEQAVALAHMRLEICTLISGSRQLAAEVADREQELQNGESKLQTVDKRPPDTVWVTRYNTAEDSSKQDDKRCQDDLEVVAGHPMFNDYGTPKLQQYWQHRSNVTSSSCDTTVTPTPTSSSTDGAKKRWKGSRYDDSEFLEDIASFIKMGGEMRKYSHNGKVQRRLFYVEGKSGKERLYWSSGSLSGHEGYISLRHITHILLGRVKEGGDVASRYLTWGIVYKQGSGATKTLDLACDSLLLLETWVIALSRLTSVQPVFGELMERNSEAEEAWSALSNSEATFCMEWHVTPDVYLEVRKQITHRQRHAPLRISPGELRNLVKLDIFRASAIWLRFYAEGCVANPKDKLHCYVRAPVVLEANIAGTRVSPVADLSGDGLSASKISF